MQARLNESLASLRGDHRLQLGSSERVDVACLRSDQQHDLGPSQSAQLVRLWLRSTR